jgi:hypothetical protein
LSLADAFCSVVCWQRRWAAIRWERDNLVKAMAQEMTARNVRSRLRQLPIMVGISGMCQDFAEMARIRPSAHAASRPQGKTPPWRDNAKAGKVHWVEIHAPGNGERGEVAATILFAAVVRTTGLKRAQRRDFFPIEPAKIPNLACATLFTAPRRA